MSRTPGGNDSFTFASHNPDMPRTIKNYRIARGWTQQELANHTSISRPRLSDMDNGKLGPTPSQLLALARAFGCSVHSIAAPQARPQGRQAVPAGALGNKFRCPAQRVARGESAGQSCLPSVRRQHPDLAPQFDVLIREHRRFLQCVRSDSALETTNHLLELGRGARSTEVAVLSLGFDRWPVLDRVTGRPAWSPAHAGSRNRRLAADFASRRGDPLQALPVGRPGRCPPSAARFHKLGGRWPLGTIGVETGSAGRLWTYQNSISLRRMCWPDQA